MLNRTQRRNIMLHQEGAILSAIGSSGAAMTSEIARAQMDGIANALIRLEGREEAAHFVFALSDRVVGGLPVTTDYLSPEILEGVKHFDLDLDEPEPEPVPSRLDWFLDPKFSWGVFVGLAVMMLVTVMAQGRA